MIVSCEPSTVAELNVAADREIAVGVVSPVSCAMRGAANKTTSRAIEYTTPASTLSRRLPAALMVCAATGMASRSS